MCALMTHAELQARIVARCQELRLHEHHCWIVASQRVLDIWAAASASLAWPSRI
jgi:hypothetical protein